MIPPTHRAGSSLMPGDPTQRRLVRPRRHNNPRPDNCNTIPSVDVIADAPSLLFCIASVSSSSDRRFDPHLRQHVVCVHGLNDGMPALFASPSTRAALPVDPYAEEEPRLADVASSTKYTRPLKLIPLWLDSVISHVRDVE